MRVVELHGVFLCKLRKIVPVACPVAAQDRLHRGGGEQILLLEAQPLALVRVVVRVKHGRQPLRLLALPHRFFVFLAVERVQVKAAHRFRLPEPQRVHARPAVADDRHVIWHGAHLLIRKRDEDGFLLAPHAPRVAEARPVVRQLALKAVVKALLEQAVAVAQAEAVQRQAVRRCGIEEAGGQAAQTAVAQRVVLHLLEQREIRTVLFHIGLALVEQARFIRLLLISRPTRNSAER